MQTPETFITKTPNYGISMSTYYDICKFYSEEDKKEVTRTAKVTTRKAMSGAYYSTVSECVIVPREGYNMERSEIMGDGLFQRVIHDDIKRGTEKAVKSAHEKAIMLFTPLIERVKGPA